MTVRNLWISLLKKLNLYRYQSYIRGLFWFAFIGSYVAAVLPQDLAPVIGSLGDKTHHILAFFILGILLSLAYEMKYRYTFLFLLLYGIFIEVSQLFAINRCAEVMDVFADLIGIVIAISLYTFLKKSILCRQ